MGRYRIGYLDDEAGQRDSFYNMFKDKFDIEIIEFDQITSPADVLTVISEENIELIVLDYKLDSTGKSFNADKVINELTRWNPHFPVLILTSHETDAFADLNNVNIVNSKTGLEKDPDTKNLFVLKIEENIKSYMKKIDTASARTAELVEKKLTAPLSASEEEEYYKYYRFLKDIDPSGRSLPSNLLTPESITSLHDFLVSSKEILKYLKEEK